MLRASVIHSLIAALALSGCTPQRPTEAVCGVDFSTFEVAQSNASPLREPPPPSIAQSLSDVSMADAFRDTVEDAPPSMRPGPVTIDILALSAGGQFGAFGAGFMRGWAENPVTPRPQFQLVTGVSAGGMIAPIVFAGTEFDEKLDAYRGLGVDQVFQRRPLLSLLSAPSVGNVQPLEDFLTDSLTDDLIAAVSESHDDGRRLFILATDIESTEASVFDLGDIAASGRSIEQKRLCMREAMLASAAIPALFPPRNIDGTLFADGGLRDQIFLESVEDARQQVMRETGRDIRVSATIVINGSLRPPPLALADGIISYTRRSGTILSDEILRDSISDVVRFAQSQPHWTVRGIFADTDLSMCSPEAISGTFDSCVTQMIFDDGRQKARMASIPWLGPEALLDLAAAR